MERRGTLARVLGVTLLLFGCGLTDSKPQRLPADAGSGGAAASNNGASGGGASGGGSSGGGSGGADAEPIGLVPNVQTLWGMFAFEDPVAIELSASTYQLFGMGCFGGRVVEPQEGFNTCQILNGTIEGRHLEFSFRADLYTYAADVYISSDQQRMAGKFHDTGGWRPEPTAWLPLGANDRWLSAPDEPAALKLALGSRVGDYDLEAVENPAAELLHLSLSDSSRGVIFSSLGAFWGTEVSWNEEEQILTAGPVPETVPDLPTQLTLHFDAELLVQVEALAPSGEVRAYTARPRP
jgi:hypothetical protein